ncbi:hypothetical protein PG996_009163 [Apiospora saccharicola]|uniref:Uncharacterized protein n=1 Tax=Apiospora saccharicola TaxID=335842 RepID=A0ABR1UJY6_9PEZI
MVLGCRRRVPEPAVPGAADGPEGPKPRVVDDLLLAADVARAMFAHLRERNARVRRLLLHSGSHGKTSTHFTHLECRLAYEACAGGSGSSSGSGSGSGSGDGDGSYVSVSSPDLGSAQNLELGRLARLVAELDEWEMPVEAALEGPQVREDWEIVQRRKAAQARIASNSQVVETEKKRSRFSNLVSSLRESRNKMWKGYLSQIGQTKREPPGS